jgi:hypothetical protein
MWMCCKFYEQNVHVNPPVFPLLPFWLERSRSALA